MTQTIAMSSPKPSPKLLDVVIQVSSGSLDFLNSWKTVLSPYHIIIIQTSGGSNLAAPAGFDIEVHAVSDATKLCGPDIWCLTAGDGLSRSFGYMLSKKKFIYSIGERVDRLEDLVV